MGSAVSVDAYSSSLDAVQGRFSALAQARPLGTRKLDAAPPAMRTVIIAAIVFAVFFATNLVYQVMRKPTEMFFPVSGATNKMPAETWRQYAPLFREYSTAIISPELLAALA